MSRLLKCCCLVAVLSASFDVIAESRVVVPVAYKNVAREYGIPYKILFAIGMQESQRELSNGKVLPWPWTLNINGDGQYFNTSGEMRKALFSALDNGIRNIDIGAMQVNLRWHVGKAYSINDMMRPEDNLNIAAKILTIEHQRCGGTEFDWMCAIGHYHSHREERAKRYAEKVMRWAGNLE